MFVGCFLGVGESLLNSNNRWIEYDYMYGVSKTFFVIVMYLIDFVINMLVLINCKEVMNGLGSCYEACVFV